MFTFGSKYFLGLAAFAFVVAAIYAGASGHHVVGMDTIIGAITLGYKGRVGDHFGYSVLITFAFCSLFLGLVFVALRDADPEAEAQLLGTDTVPEAVPPTTSNFWPIVGAFSVGALLLGLVVGKTLVVIGLVGLVVTILEWGIRTWADRATGDPEVNRAIRNRLMYPVEVPVIAVLGVGALRVQHLPRPACVAQGRVVCRVRARARRGTRRRLADRGSAQGQQLSGRGTPAGRWTGGARRRSVRCGARGAKVPQGKDQVRGQHRRRLVASGGSLPDPHVTGQYDLAGREIVHETRQVPCEGAPMVRGRLRRAGHHDVRHRDRGAHRSELR